VSSIAIGEQTRSITSAMVITLLPILGTRTHDFEPFLDIVDPVVLFSLADPVAYIHNMAVVEIILDRHLSMPPRRERDLEIVSVLQPR